MNISDIIWLKPMEKSIPMYNWCDWIYTPFNNYSQLLLNCVSSDCSMITDLLTSSDWSILINLCNLTIWNIDTLIHLILNWQNLEIANNILDLSWLYSNFMFNIWDWHNTFPLHMWSIVNINGVDWLHFNVVWSDTIEIWLPVPDLQYFVPGRCTPMMAVYAYRVWWISGMSTEVVITADNAWTIGNITLLTDWISTIQELVNVRNIANPSNTLTLIYWDWTQIPTNNNYIELSHWADTITCQPWNYQPFNKWLVLTWNNCCQQAEWMPPQCCIQTLIFNGESISINSWWHFSNWYTCSCGWCEPNWWCNCWNGGSTNIIIPPPQPVLGINTDNQELTLTFDTPTSIDLCLSRWHGGTLWVQIPDPDSCVNLININEHTLSIQGNLLYLLWSDSLVNSIVNLSLTNEHTIWLINDTLYIYWSDWLENNNVDLEAVAQEHLVINWNTLCVEKSYSPSECDACSHRCIELPIWVTCDDVTNCMCSTEIDWVDEWVTPMPGDACWYDPVLPSWPIDCSDFWQRQTWSAQTYLEWERVIHNWQRWWANADTTAWDVPWTSALWDNISTSLRPNDAWADFFSVPRTTWQLMSFLINRIWWLYSNPCEWCCSWWPSNYTYVEWDIWIFIKIIIIIILKQKYWARIEMSDNTRMWSRHFHSEDGSWIQLDTDNRWFIPNFDLAEWRHSINTDMVDPSMAISASATNLLIPWAVTPLNMIMGTWYDVAPSTNNINSITWLPWTNIESHFSQAGSRVIHIVKDWLWNVELQWRLFVDHNVRWFRYSVMRYNVQTNNIDLILDNYYSSWLDSWSMSVNNPIIPVSKDWSVSSSKVIELHKWDILFPAVKIDPRTRWPNQSDCTPNTVTYPPNPPSPISNDLLVELAQTVITFPAAQWYGEHTPWVFTPWDDASWEDVTRSPGDSFAWWAITWNFQEQNLRVPNNIFNRPTQNLPNLSPRYFRPTWGQDGAENYGWNLWFPGWQVYVNTESFWKYRDDDGCITLYGNADWRYNTDATPWKQWADNSSSSLTVHRVNSLQ